MRIYLVSSNCLIETENNRCKPTDDHAYKYTKSMKLRHDFKNAKQSSCVECRIDVKG